MTDSDTQRLALGIVSQTPEVLRQLLSSAPATAVEQPNDEGWSPKDVVAHLLDTDGIAFRGRIGRIVDEDHPLIQPIDPPAHLDAQGYRARALDSLLDEFARERRDAIDRAAALTPDQLARSGEHAEAGEITATTGPATTSPTCARSTGCSAPRSPRTSATCAATWRAGKPRTTTAIVRRGTP